jgi:chromosome segregation ATPase
LNRKKKELSLREKTYEVHSENYKSKERHHKQNQNEIQKLGKEIKKIEKTIHNRLGDNLPSTEKLFEKLQREEMKVKDKEEMETNLQQKISKNEINLKEIKNNLDIAGEEVKVLKKRMNEYQSEKSQLDEQISDNQKELLTLENENKIFLEKRANIALLEERETQIEKQKRELEGVEDKFGKLEHAEKNIRRECKTFRGELGDLVSLIDSKFKLACGLALGPKLGYYVIDKQNEFSIVDRILTQNYLNKNVIVLENYPKNREANLLKNMRLKVMNNGWLAYDLLELRDKSDRLVDDYLKGSLAHVYVTTDLKGAFELKKKLGNKFRRIITLKGEMVKKQSIESLGHSTYMPLYMKKLQDFNIVRERTKLEGELEKIRKQKSELEGQGPKKQIEKVQNQLKRLGDKLKTVILDKEKTLINLNIKEEEMFLEQKKFDHLSKEIKQFSSELSKLNKDCS